MDKYVFHSGKPDGSDWVEFRKGSVRDESAFLRTDSLYVSDNAFFFFLEAIIKEVIPSFDMFQETCMVKRQWDEIMELNIAEIIDASVLKDAQVTLKAIHCWIECHIGDDEEFTIIGV